MIWMGRVRLMKMRMRMRVKVSSLVYYLSWDFRMILFLQCRKFLHNAVVCFYDILCICYLIL